MVRAKGLSFDLILLLYMQERLLYRLSISNYKERFVLKGGLIILGSTNILPLILFGTFSLFINNLWLE